MDLGMSIRHLAAASLISIRASGTQRQQGSQQHLREQYMICKYESVREADAKVTPAGSSLPAGRSCVGSLFSTAVGVTKGSGEANANGERRLKHR
jgi:hypothetical protein